MPRSAITMPRQQVRNTGTCLQFGSGKNVTHAEATNLKPTSITVACWVKNFTRTGVQTYIRRWFNAGYIFRINSGKYSMQVQTNAAKTLNSSADPSLNVWEHVASTYDASTGAAAIYINGVLDNSTTHAGGNITYGTTDSFYLGNSSVNEFHNGRMDEPRVYNRALSATEILNLYTGNEPDTTGLVSKWLFDEGSGTSATDSATGGNTGTISGATYVTDPIFLPRIAVT
jgi:hypothetical protein